MSASNPGSLMWCIAMTKVLFGEATPHMQRVTQVHLGWFRTVVQRTVKERELRD